VGGWRDALLFLKEERERELMKFETPGELRRLFKIEA